MSDLEKQLRDLRNQIIKKSMEVEAFAKRLTDLRDEHTSLMNEIAALEALGAVK
ncbi:MAG TPA: hypothetical protein VEF53_18760 [Patescibacteria group bacterium]|nr:hypothetical protein [Patescibacteria group bacterium]